MGLELDSITLTEKGLFSGVSLMLVLLNLGVKPCWGGCGAEVAPHGAALLLQLSDSWQG